MATEIRTGDAVFHRPTGETWLVAWCKDGKLCACGWPETIADVADCVRTREATDEQSIALLREMAHLSDTRGAYAREALEAANG